MHRFYVPPGQVQDAAFVLPEREAHHAFNVLRVRTGERVAVLDGAGTELLCEVRAADKRRVELSVVQRHSIPALPYQLTLVQAVPKGKAMELIVQKATELGARRIVPILSERTVAHVDDEQADSKVEKWEAIAIDALKQCGSAWLPRIERPVSPQSFLGSGEPSDMTLIATLQSGARHPREQLDAFTEERKRRPKSIAVWIGPEGDFTPAEINAIRGAGALPITLGQLILRSETAAIYTLAVLNYELQSPPHS